MEHNMNWFEVDKDGLAKILERRGKAFALAELVSNAWDSGTKRVDVKVEPVPSSPFANISVEDWGEGFEDLSHSHTMFGKSTRADKPTLRGRFNLGEKLVLACCREAEIVTTTGGMRFNSDGRSKIRQTRPLGTLFTATIRMTRDELVDVNDFMRRMLPPVATTYNGVEIDRPDSLMKFSVKLPTEIADDDGNLRRSVRMAEVEVYESFGDKGELLELGVPVVELDLPYRVNVLQKIPLNMDRDNATPSFLSAVKVAVLNQMHTMLTPDEAAKPWVQEAAGDSRAHTETVKSVIVKRFGDRAVVATPGDPMANANAEANGYTVIPGGALSGDLWANVRKGNLLLPAGQVFPSPKPEDVAAKKATGTCPMCGK
jgi:hypothetical protein